ncbi:hypothetical protein THOG11_60176 [Vibrio harveyi]|nr:hypothetical protein TH15OA1_430114 [Vibrio harveyi]CAH1542744.1 hypothetical protein THOG05_40338 [Vibrio rotiferianus]CAH1574607.1 hypothetical protein THOD03_50177 [Vibrio harveyi]CAH1583891.1 hypothetical protein THOG11_60176 [Vibrio harveyi]
MHRNRKTDAHGAPNSGLSAPVEAVSKNQDKIGSGTDNDEYA